MSTSLLYHGFGVRGYQHRRTDFMEGDVVFTIEQERSTFACSACGSKRVESRGSVMRVFQNLPIGGKATYIHFPVPRVFCLDCGVFRQVKIGFAEPRRRHTRALERYAVELCRHMTMQDVADHLGIGWDRVKEMQKRHLNKRFARPRLKDLKEIAIDEVSIQHGYRFLTVVLDLRRGAVVYIGEGKDAKALKPFWRRLNASGAEVEAVATDMSKAYIAAVREALPEATHVFDRFHVLRLYNQKLAQLRRELYREATDQLQKNVLKGTRWLLLMNPENLDPDRNERDRLAEALRLNEPLAIAYYLKEDLRQFWEQPDKRTAWRYLDSWIGRADASGIRVVRQFATTLATYRSGLLAYYDYPITTGPLEGTMNKIKTLNRQAYGYRDHDFFKLKIYSAHEMNYHLVG